MENTIVKRNAGITLIALVITIIVLLILASVSIAMLTGENGILNQANKAKTETRAGAVQEARDLWMTNRKMDKMSGVSTSESRETLLNNLVGQKLLTNEEKQTIEETGKITIGSRTINFSISKTLVEMFNSGELKVGDYVNYMPVEGTKTEVTTAETGYGSDIKRWAIDTTQRYTVDTNTTWRVLGLSEDKQHLLLTSGSPIKKDGDNPYLILQGATSYNKCIPTLNKICSIYKNNYAEEVRSMTIDDINNCLGITVDREKNIVYKNDNPETNIDLGGVMGQTYTYKEGDWTSDEEKLEAGNPKIGTTVTGTAYGYPTDPSMQNQAGLNIVDPNSKIYEILFKGTTEAERYAKAYWLASPGVYVNSSLAFFGPGAVYGGGASSGYYLFDSDGYWNAFELAVRPVVSLKSDITEEEIQKIADKVEPEWNTESGQVNSGNLNGENAN